MIFITGSTGFLGREIVARLLLNDPQLRVALLVRDTLFESAASRARKCLSETIGEEFADSALDRVKVYRGDMEEKNLGLSSEDFIALSKEVTEIFHCAASTTLDLPIEKARLANVFGTKEVLSLCNEAFKQQGKFPHLHHVSTAYVAGATNEVVSPDELRFDRGFRNTYEQSKAEAELLVRGFHPELHFTIYRPSIIVGNSVTGKTTAFNVIYIPAKFLAKGLFRALPGIPHVPFDIVPVDYVADAIVALSKRNLSKSSSFHVSAGLGRETTPKEILDFIIDTVNRYRTRSKRSIHTPAFLPPEIVSMAQQSLILASKNITKLISKHLSVIRHILPFVPYMTSNPRFDTSATVKELQGLVSPPPLFSDYAQRVFHYCLDTNWGKTPKELSFKSLQTARIGS